MLAQPPKHPIYHKVKELLYPELTVEDFNKLGIRILKENTSERIALFLSSFFKRYILASDLKLYLTVKDDFYPILETNDFSAFRKEHPQKVNGQEISKLILEETDDYISRDYKDLYLQVKDHLVPELTVPDFAAVIKKTRLRSPKKIAAKISKENFDYLTKEYVEKVKGLVYPTIEKSVIIEFRKERGGESDPMKLARKIGDTVPAYIPIAEKPLFGRVSRRFYNQIPVKFFSHIRKSHPEIIKDEKIADLIDRKYPGKGFKIYREAKSQIIPEPTIEELRKFRMIRKGLLSAWDLVRAFTQEHREHITIYQESQFEAVRSKLFPIISIADFGKVLKPDSGLGKSDKIAKRIADINPNFLRIEYCDKVREKLHPRISNRKIHSVSVKNGGHLPAADLAVLIAEKSDEYILKKDKPLFHQTAALLYPDLTLQDFSQLVSQLPRTDPAVLISEKSDDYILKEDKKLFDQTAALLYPDLSLEDFSRFISHLGRDHNAHSLAELIANQSKKYVMQRHLDDTAQFLYPKPEKDVLLGIIQKFDLKKSSKQLASKVAEQHLDYLLKEENESFQKIRGQFSPKLSLRDYCEFQRIYPELDWEDNLNFLRNEFSFCSSVRDKLHPKPDLGIIIEWMEKNPEIRKPSRLAENMAQSLEEFSLYKDVLKSKSWYG